MYLNGYITLPDVIPESEIGLYVQDTMDELEFTMGSTYTPYGALHASLDCTPSPYPQN
jgi:alpha-N-arabinofuranosidase